MYIKDKTPQEGPRDFVLDRPRGEGGASSVGRGQDEHYAAASTVHDVQIAGREGEQRRSKYYKLAETSTDRRGGGLAYGSVVLSSAGPTETHALLADDVDSALSMGSQVSLPSLPVEQNTDGSPPPRPFKRVGQGAR